MSRKQERSQKAFSSAITLAAADYPHSFYEAGLAHVALLLPVLNFPCKRNLFHYGTSGVCLPSLPPGKKGPIIAKIPPASGKKDSPFLLPTPEQVACPTCPSPLDLESWTLNPQVDPSFERKKPSGGWRQQKKQKIASNDSQNRNVIFCDKENKQNRPEFKFRAMPKKD
jgi:hypothetical protein